MIRVGIIGVGNCASSLVQGVEYYRDAQPGEFTPGLLHPRIGKYGPKDIEFVAAFDVDAHKVTAPLHDAIFRGQNNTIKFAKPVAKVKVHAAPQFDGIGERYSEKIMERGLLTCDEDEVHREIKRTKPDVLVNYLPVGSEDASRFWAGVALEHGCAFVNCIPVFIASDPFWQSRFKNAGLPLLGDDIKSQLGATIFHRMLANLLTMRGLKIERTYQLNFGGNMDFYNMLQSSRLNSKKKSKRGAVAAELPYELAPDQIHISPSDFVSWLEDRKWAFIRVEATAFGGVPLTIETKMEVWDSPNSAGVVIDAVRVAKLALDRHIPGALIGPAAFFMKSPPVQLSDDQAAQALEEFIATGSPTTADDFAEVSNGRH